MEFKYVFTGLQIYASTETFSIKACDMSFNEMVQKVFNAF